MIFGIKCEFFEFELTKMAKLTLQLFFKRNKNYHSRQTLVQITDEGYNMYCAPHNIFVQWGLIIGLIETEDANAEITEVNKVKRHESERK